MKGLEWLKEEVGYIDMTKLDKHWKEEVFDLIDQIEQPDYNDMFDRGYKDGYKTAKNQMPEQPELPVIPEYVAEYIEDKKEKGLGLRFIFWSIEGRYIHSRYMDKCQKWIYNNSELFSRAWLDGYTVEEKKYLVEDKKHALLCKVDGKNVQEIISTIESTADDLPIDLLEFELTEQEIKSYDEKYMVFAIPVEEINE